MKPFLYHINTYQYSVGVIFIDEFHQLNDSEEGRNALKAMVPMLADPESRTVFIGAGYTGPVEVCDSICLKNQSNNAGIIFAEFYYPENDS